MDTKLSENCIEGTIHVGVPAGTEETIHGLNTYIIGNRISPRGIIVICSDILGLPLPNIKIIADAYAKSGNYLVYLPDFFDGNPIPPKMADILLPVDASKQGVLAKYGAMLAAAPQFLLWMTRHEEEATNKVCMDFMERLRRDTHGSGKKIGVVGFCWGGKFAIRAAREQNMIGIGGKKVSLVDAAVALHPSHVSLPGDVDKLVVPVSVGWGVEDEGVNFAQKGEIEGIHEQMRKEGTALPQIEHKVYTPGRYGFALRGNPEDPNERKCLEDSMTQGLDWFRRWI